MEPDAQTPPEAQPPDASPGAEGPPPPPGPEPSAEAAGPSSAAPAEVDVPDGYVWVIPASEADLARARGELREAVEPPAARPQADNLLHFFNPDALPYALLLVIGTVVLMRFLSRLGDRISERLLQHRLAIKQAHTVIAFAAYVIVAVLASSSLFTLSSEAVLALSGTIAVVLGFALKDVASSFLAGLSILANKPFQVGDRISFGGFYGEVTEMGLRTVRLVTLDDNLVTIPSNRFLNDAVASANAGSLDCMVVVKFWVKPHVDHRHARSIVRDAVLATPYLYLGKPVTMLVGTRITDDGKVFIELTAKAYVYDARHESAFSSDVCDRVLTAFRAEGWEMGV